jgi:hypothetical protein
MTPSTQCFYNIINHISTSINRAITPIKISIGQNAVINTKPIIIILVLLVKRTPILINKPIKKYIK